MAVLLLLQKPSTEVAIKIIHKKNLAKSQSLLDKEIKILKVRKLIVNSMWIQSTEAFILPLVQSEIRLYDVELVYLSQELTELKHENVVTLLECGVSIYNL